MLRFFTFIAWPLLVVPQACTYLGALLNQIAIAANRGRMPVWYGACADAARAETIDNIHSCLTHATHFKILCDWINLHDVILSPGDVLLYLGDAIVGPLFWMWIAYALFCMFAVEDMKCPANQ